MPADTSTGADRATFDQAVTGGAPITLNNSIANLANCQLVMPETTTYMLGMAYPSTYAAGSAVVSPRMVAGMAPF